MKVIEEKLKGMKDIFEEYPHLVAAYLFGSYAKRKVWPMSDVDIAVLFNDDVSRGRELIHEMDFLGYRIARGLGVKKVDVIDLKNQGLVFQHNVLRTGILIYDRNPDLRIRFVVRVISDFCDFEPTLRFIERFKIQGIINRCNKL
jgi:uncharacterized protein